MHNELTCGECNVKFNSAGLLLKHFAQHANEVGSSCEATKSSDKKLRIPDLYPISSFSILLKGDKQEEVKDDIDLAIEDRINPLQYCLVTLQDCSSELDREKLKTRKYECPFCLKMFGWSTDLKRHILTHTGEKPFKCDFCDAAFTRKFLLQKHFTKQHSHISPNDTNVIDEKIDLPPLKPISFILNKKSRKQDKGKIKQNKSTKILYECFNDKFGII